MQPWDKKDNAKEKLIWDSGNGGWSAFGVSLNCSSFSLDLKQNTGQATVWHYVAGVDQQRSKARIDILNILETQKPLK